MPSYNISHIIENAYVASEHVLGVNVESGRTSPRVRWR